MRKTFVFLFTLSLFALTISPVWAKTQLNQKKIVKVQTYADYFVIQFTPAQSNNESCAGDVAKREGFAYFDIKASSHGGNMYSTAMSAMMTGRTIGLGLEGCNGWGGGIPKAYRIDISAE